MEAVTLKAIVGEDRKLIVELPSDMPIGEIELTVRPIGQPAVSLRDMLMADGALVTDIEVPMDAELIPEEELLELTGNIPTERTALDDVNEDRDER